MRRHEIPRLSGPPPDRQLKLVDMHATHTDEVVHGPRPSSVQLDDNCEWAGQFVVALPDGTRLHPATYARVRSVLQGRVPGVEAHAAGFDVVFLLESTNEADAELESRRVVADVLGSLVLPVTAVVQQRVIDLRPFA